MGRILIDTDIWELIVSHYGQIDNPSPEDRKVMQFILDKEHRRMNHDDYLESRSRYARLSNIDSLKK